MNSVGSKLIKLVVVNVLTYYIIGLSLLPLSGFFQSIINNNEITYLAIKLSISLIVLAISLFIVTNFVTLLAGEAKKIALGFALLDLVFGIYTIIASRIIISSLNSLSGQNIQSPPIYLPIVYNSMSFVLVYILIKAILSKYESTKTQNV